MAEGDILKINEYKKMEVVEFWRHHVLFRKKKEEEALRYKKLKGK